MSSMPQPIPSSVTVSLPKLILRVNDAPHQVVSEIPADMQEIAPVRIAARGIALRNDDMLLVREGLTGRWSIPGGGAEDGETPEDAVRREMLEETGFVVTRTTLAAEVWELFGDRLYVTYVFICEGRQDGDVRLTDEETHAEQVPIWRTIGDATTEFSKGLPDEATEWYEDDGSFRPELECLSRYLVHAEGIYAREEAILRTLFPYG